MMSLSVWGIVRAHCIRYQDSTRCVMILSFVSQGRVRRRAADLRQIVLWRFRDLLLRSRSHTLSGSFTFLKVPPPPLGFPNDELGFETFPVGFRRVFYSGSG